MAAMTLRRVLALFDRPAREPSCDSPCRAASSDHSLTIQRRARNPLPRHRRDEPATVPRHHSNSSALQLITKAGPPRHSTVDKQNAAPCIPIDRPHPETPHLIITWRASSRKHFIKRKTTREQPIDLIGDGDAFHAPVEGKLASPVRDVGIRAFLRGRPPHMFPSPSGRSRGMLPVASHWALASFIAVSKHLRREPQRRTTGGH